MDEWYHVNIKTPIFLFESSLVGVGNSDQDIRSSIGGKLSRLCLSSYPKIACSPRSFGLGEQPLENQVHRVDDDPCVRLPESNLTDVLRRPVVMFEDRYINLFSSEKPRQGAPSLVVQ